MKRNRNECASGEMGPAGVCIQTCCFSSEGAGDAGGRGVPRPFQSGARGRERRPPLGGRGTGRAAPCAGSRGRCRPRFEAAGAARIPARRGREGRRDGWMDGCLGGWSTVGTLSARRQAARCPSALSRPQPGTACPARLSRRSACARPRPWTCTNLRSHNVLHHFQVAQEEKPNLKTNKA